MSAAAKNADDLIDTCCFTDIYLAFVIFLDGIQTQQTAQYKLFVKHDDDDDNLTGWIYWCDLQSKVNVKARFYSMSIEIFD